MTEITDIEYRDKITDIICDALNNYGMTEESNHYKAEIIFEKLKSYLKQEASE